MHGINGRRGLVLIWTTVTSSRLNVSSRSRSSRRAQKKKKKLAPWVCATSRESEQKIRVEEVKGNESGISKEVKSSYISRAEELHVLASMKDFRTLNYNFRICLRIACTCPYVWRIQYFYYATRNEHNDWQLQKKAHRIVLFIHPSSSLE